jgi:hypothetical protein
MIFNQTIRTWNADLSVMFQKWFLSIFRLQRSEDYTGMQLSQARIIIIILGYLKGSDCCLFSTISSVEAKKDGGLEHDPECSKF